MAAFAALSAKLYGGSQPGSPNLLAAGWLIAGMAGIAFGAQAMLPWRYWLSLLKTGGRLWAYASVAILLACVAGNISRLLWQPASYVTFTLVRLLLKPFMAGLFADPALLALGTRRFGVIIAPECSGLEGAGLILAFGAVWVLLFRRECRFPQSLALVLVGRGCAVSGELGPHRGSHSHRRRRRPADRHGRISFPGRLDSFQRGLGCLLSDDSQCSMV
jgi:hypothetical protein